MTEFTMYKFDAPILGNVAEHPDSPYTEKQWNDMLHYDFNDGNPNPAPTHHEFYRAMGELSSRSMDLTAPYHVTTPMNSMTPMNQMASSSSSPPPSSKPKKTIAALTTWCGFSKKAMAAHKQYNVQDKVEELYCDKEHKNHPVCQKTTSYPIYYDANHNVLKKGFPVHNPAMFYQSL